MRCRVERQLDMQTLSAMADRIITVKNGTIVSEVLNDHIVPVEQIEW